EVEMEIGAVDERPCRAEVERSRTRPPQLGARAGRLAEDDPGAEAVTLRVRRNGRTHGSRHDESDEQRSPPNRSRGGRSRSRASVWSCSRRRLHVGTSWMVFVGPQPILVTTWRRMPTVPTAPFVACDTSIMFVV